MDDRRDLRQDQVVHLSCPSNVFACPLGHFPLFSALDMHKPILVPTSASQCRCRVTMSMPCGA
eukprot:scaffold81534_cov31-Tisochrysis_lutea.AAC.1